MRPVVAAIALSLLAPSAALAQAPPTVILEDLTSTEVRDAVRAGWTTIILPTGGTEQNGRHMALGKHNYVVRHAAEQIARRLGRTLVAPVLAYVPEGDVDPPSGHMRFPGTITLPPEHYAKVLEYAARSFRASGFRDIVLIGDSGGNQAGQREVADRLSRQWAATGTRIHHVPDYYTAGRDPHGPFARWLESQGHAPGDIGRHAGIADTSLLMAVEPRLVRGDRPARRDPASGVHADAAGASAAYGHKGLELMIEAAIRQIRSLMRAR
jgi:creatinine amidohydrolase/Fe(II)-dependent formamide hydrolase-like protein